jgi:hypothetical protein
MAHVTSEVGALSNEDVTNLPEEFNLLNFNPVAVHPVTELRVIDCIVSSSLIEKPFWHTT